MIGTTEIAQSGDVLSGLSFRIVPLVALFEGGAGEGQTAVGNRPFRCAASRGWYNCSWAGACRDSGRCRRCGCFFSAWLATTESAKSQEECWDERESANSTHGAKLGWSSLSIKLGLPFDPACHEGYSLPMKPEDSGDRSEREEPDAERRHFSERLLPEIIKRIVEAGVIKIAEGPENLRHFVNDLKLPKDVGSYVFSQIDDTKNGLYRVVAKEIRDFLEHTNMADELTHALTKLSFEIRTEIRFVPNDTNPKLFPKPDVKAQVTVKDEKDKVAPPTEERPRRKAR